MSKTLSASDELIETIRDFNVQLYYTDWWRFKKIKWLKKQINFYEKLLEEHENIKN